MIFIYCFVIFNTVYLILVPTAPPQNVSAGVINATSAWIRWDPPPIHSWNGDLSGYLV